MSPQETATLIFVGGLIAGALCLLVGAAFAGFCIYYLVRQLSKPKETSSRSAASSEDKLL